MAFLLKSDIEALKVMDFVRNHNMSIGVECYHTVTCSDEQMETMINAIIKNWDYEHPNLVGDKKALKNYFK